MPSTPIPSHGSRRTALLLRLASATELTCVQPHPQGALLLAGGQDGSVLLFTSSNGALVQRLVPPGQTSSPACCVAWAELSETEHIAVGHKSGNVRVWDVERGAVVSTMAAHRADVTALAYMAPLALLATGSVDTNIKLWGLAAGGTSHAPAISGTAVPAAGVLREALVTLKGHAAPITHLQFAPDASLLISGDAAGGLRVWQLPGPGSGAGVASGGGGVRLLHNLSGHHAAAITGIACHPEERLFVSASLDRTLRAWDMDAAAGSCVAVHGPEGRRELRAVAFTSGGKALLAAYPDGLRSFTLDPLVHHDTVEVQWSKVSTIRYTDGKLIGISLHKGDASLHCINLTTMQPFARHHEAAPAPGAAAAPPAASDASGVQPGPAALFVARQRQQAAAAAAVAAVLEPNNRAGPRVEVFAAPRRLHHAQHATFTAAAPSPGSTAAAPGAAAGSMAPAGGAGTLAAAGQSRHRGSSDEKDGWQRQSAEENRVLGSSSGGLPLVPEGKGESAPNKPAAMAPQPTVYGLTVGEAAPPHSSMLAVATPQGFLAAATQGHRQLCSALRTKRRVWHKVQVALQEHSDVRAAVRLLKDSNDLGIVAAVVDCGALQCRADRFSLEMCADGVPLIGALLASAAPLHHQAALRLLDAILTRWGDYVRDVLSSVRRQSRQVDLELERRQERSAVLRSGLLGLAPALERVAATQLGGGSAAQALARLNDLR